MTIGDLNLCFIIFFLIFTSITLNVNTALHLLLTAELLWITLYIIVLFVGLIFDNLNILSLTFFFLILSAVEFGIGLIIMLVQNLINRSLSLNNSSMNYLKFSTRFSKKVNFINTKLFI